MRYPWKAVLVAVLLSPLSAPADQVKPGSCEASVGAWEFVPPSAPGRGVIARRGTTYHAAFLLTATNPDTGAAAPWAAAQECTCEGSAGKLRWRCRVIHAIDKADVGAEWTFEWHLQDDSLKSCGSTEVACP